MSAKPDRPRTGQTRLSRLFSPSAVAVLGASANPDSIGGQPIRHLVNAGFQGALYPINPKYEQVDGLRCYPDIDALPQTPDVLVIAVAARRVAAFIEQAGDTGIPYVVVFSSGFAESGVDGAAAQQRLGEVAAAGGVTLIGPNCQGLINIAEGIPIGFGAPYALRYRSGAVSVSSQSGAFGNSVLMGLNDEGVGFRHYISTGNEAETTSLDCIEHFLDDPGTQVIAGYVEGFQDAYRLRELGGKALARDKPMVLWKVGNTTAGAKAASSHTANLAGAYSYYDAAFRQYGIVDAHDVGDMADCVRALIGGKRAGGSGVAVLSISGGAGIAMADRCADFDLELPALTTKTVDRLRPLLPAFASLTNPVDITAGALDNPESFSAALDVVADDPGVDMIGLCLAALSGNAATLIAREIASLASKSELPVLVAWSAPEGGAEQAYAILEAAGIPRYKSPVRCARGLGALWRFGEAATRQPEMSTLEISAPPTPAQTSALNEFDAKAFLARHQLPVTHEGVALDAQEAVRLAQRIGYPVVLKVLSRDIAHKSDAGGVRVGLGDDESVRSAYQDLAALPAQLGRAVSFDGVLVQELVAEGEEVILGAVNDPSFGPMLMFGAGGVFAEVFEDVAFRTAPVTRAEAEALVAETRIAQILDGARGRPEADMPALIETILRLSALAVSESERFTEIDINPLFVLPKGQGVRVGDAYVRLAEPQ